MHRRVTHRVAVERVGPSSEERLSQRYVTAPRGKEQRFISWMGRFTRATVGAILVRISACLQKLPSPLRVSCEARVAQRTRKIDGTGNLSHLPGQLGFILSSVVLCVRKWSAAVPPGECARGACFLWLFVEVTIVEEAQG
jgi:hypothetical protein